MADPILEINQPIPPIQPAEPTPVSQPQAINPVQIPRQVENPIPQPAPQLDAMLQDPAMRGNSLDAQMLQLAEIAKLNPNVDVANLMLGALDKQHVNETSSKSKRWVYMVSVGLPGAGYIFAIYYYFFSGKSDGKHVAWWCFGLTTFTIILTWLTTSIIFSSVTQTTGQSINVNTLQQQPAQLKQLLNQ